jgi:hypothetical protein
VKLSAMSKFSSVDDFLIADAQKGNSQKATRAAIVMKSTTSGGDEEPKEMKEEETTVAKVDENETTAGAVEVTKDIDP